MTGASELADALLPKTKAAIAYAERKHSGQQRSDGSPFIKHPLEVASVLQDAGAPDHLVAAGVLHDVLEKTDVSVSALKRHFGTKTALLVAAVSDDDSIASYAKRKAALRRQAAAAGDEALTLFAADKLSKMRELHREAERGRDAGRQVRVLRARRIKHYQRSLAMVEERIPDSPVVGALRDEYRALLELRGTTPAMP